MSAMPFSRSRRRTCLGSSSIRVPLLAPAWTVCNVVPACSVPASGFERVVQRAHAPCERTKTGLKTAKEPGRVGYHPDFAAGNSVAFTDNAPVDLTFQDVQRR